MLERREFIRCAGVAAAGLAVPALAQGASPAPRHPGHRSVYFDAQGVIGSLNAGDGAALDRELRQAIAERRIDVISQSILPVGNVPNALRVTTEALGRRDLAVSSHPGTLLKVQSMADLRRARASQRIGVIYNLQDSAAHEGDPANVAHFASLGIRQMQLTYNKRNLAGDGCLERSNAGLSDFGRELVAAINAANVVLDLSHSGQRTTAEGIAASTAPPIISHGGCRALVDHPRNAGDTEMRAVADKGGVFGVYLMPFLRPQGQPNAGDFLRHLEHAVNVCGEDHVGIGTDNFLAGIVIDDAARRQQRDAYDKRLKAGIVAPGEARDIFTLVEGFNDVARYDRIGAAVRRRGWSSRRIEKVLGDNFVRVYGEVWKR